MFRKYPQAQVNSQMNDMLEWVFYAIPNGEVSTFL